MIIISVRSALHHVSTLLYSYWFLGLTFSVVLEPIYETIIFLLEDKSLTVDNPSSPTTQ